MAILVVWCGALGRDRNDWGSVVKTSDKGQDNSAQAHSIHKYLATNFGIPELMTSWYPNILGVSIKGDTVIVQTSLSSADEKAGHICGGTSGYVFSNENSSSGLQNVQIVGVNGDVLIDRRGIGDTCDIAQEIEIKGLKIGMTQEEVESKFGTPPLQNFTIAGVSVLNPAMDFHEGRLDYILFTFDSSSFNHVIEAFKEKYPSLECQSSPRAECHLYDDANNILYIKPFSADDISASSISFASRHWLDERVKSNDESKNDI